MPHHNHHFLHINIHHHQQHQTLLTEGPIPQRIISFALPLFLGNLFQQLYNTADSLIVGNFLGSEALAAVSSSGSLIFLMVGFFNGIALGAGVVTARYFGAKDYETTQKSIHTTVSFGIVCGLLLMVLGIFLAPQILIWMGTPENVLPNSVLYFRVYFCGSLAFVLYNIFVGILQSVGDSRRPLLYLIISSLTNIALDLFFIAVPREYRISLKKLKIDRQILRQIISNGLPSGIQNSIISIANVVVQSNINAFGPTAMAGCGSYSKIEGFGFLPITCFAMSLTTFVSQSLGAKQYDRAKKGAYFGIICSITLAELVGITIYLASPVLISLFNREADVVAFGVMQAHTVTLFYFLLAFSHCIAGILRGAGKAIVPMLVMMVCWCVIRVSYITIAVRIVPQIQTVFWAYPLTWSLSSIVFLIYFLKADWIHGFEKKKNA